jgi:hypothetical protein
MKEAAWIQGSIQDRNLGIHLMERVDMWGSRVHPESLPHNPRPNGQTRGSLNWRGSSGRTGRRWEETARWSPTRALGGRGVQGVPV